MKTHSKLCHELAHTYARFDAACLARDSAEMDRAAAEADQIRARLCEWVWANMSHQQREELAEKVQKLRDNSYA